MTEQQRLFLVQGKSGFLVFDLLRKTPKIHPCHALHYLQMATEMLGKAYVWRSAPPEKLSHRAFVPFLRNIKSNRAAQKQLGYEGQNEQWQNLIRKLVPLAREVERLAPTLAGNGPNPEYPWPPSMPLTAPAEHDFQLWATLQKTVGGRSFHAFVGQLFDYAGSFL